MNDIPDPGQLGNTDELTTTRLVLLTNCRPQPELLGYFDLRSSKLLTETKND